MQNDARVICAYADLDQMRGGEASGGRKARLPGPADEPPTERPGA